MSTLPVILPAPRPRSAPAPAQSATDYMFTVPADARVALARGWLHLGLAALVGSGLFSILLVASRTPGINRWLPAADFFHVALVVHVDLSVLVWFVALAGMLWSLNSSAGGLRWGRAALALAALGTAAMTLAPFTGAGVPVGALVFRLHDTVIGELLALRARAHFEDARLVHALSRIRIEAAIELLFLVGVRCVRSLPCRSHAVPSTGRVAAENPVVRRANHVCGTRGEAALGHALQGFVRPAAGLELQPLLKRVDDAELPLRARLATRHGGIVVTKGPDAGVAPTLRVDPRGVVRLGKLSDEHYVVGVILREFVELHGVRDSEALAADRAHEGLVVNTAVAEAEARVVQREGAAGERRVRVIDANESRRESLGDGALVGE